MFLSQCYKLLDLQKLPAKVKHILKADNLKRQLIFDDAEAQDEFLPVLEQGENEMAVKVTKKDAAKIAQLVTTIDMEQEKGVEALYHILSIIQQGGSTVEAIGYCMEALAPKKGQKK